MLRLRCVNWIWFWNVLDIWECAGKDVLKSPACKACNGGPPLIYSFLCSLLFFSCSLPLSFHVTICTRCMQADVYIYIHIHRCMHIYIDYIYIYSEESFPHFDRVSLVYFWGPSMDFEARAQRLRWVHVVSVRCVGLPRLLSTPASVSHGGPGGDRQHLSSLFVAYLIRCAWFVCRPCGPCAILFGTMSY